jgi:energy-coupling factor transporter ATP-binding protein EcfA2
MLLREPFSAVESVVRKHLQAQFLRLQGELGKTIPFVTHDIGEAIKLADNVAVMRPGGTLAVPEVFEPHQANATPPPAVQACGNQLSADPGSLRVRRTASGPSQPSVPRAHERSAPATRLGSCSRTAMKHPPGSAAKRTAKKSGGAIGLRAPRCWPVREAPRTLLLAGPARAGVQQPGRMLGAGLLCFS